jgi:hypothetical protein
MLALRGMSILVPASTIDPRGERFRARPYGNRGICSDVIVPNVKPGILAVSLMVVAILLSDST